LDYRRKDDGNHRRSDVHIGARAAQCRLSSIPKSEREGEEGTQAQAREAGLRVCRRQAPSAPCQGLHVAAGAGASSRHWHQYYARCAHDAVLQTSRRRGAGCRLEEAKEPKGVYVDPHDPLKRTFLYLPTIKKRYGWKRSTVTKWRLRDCPALGRLITAIPAPSRYSSRTEEWVYLEEDLDKIKAVFDNMKLKWGKLTRRPRGERGRILPLALHASSNGDTDGVEQRPKKKKDRGNQPLSDEERYQLHDDAVAFRKWMADEGQGVRNPKRVYEEIKKLPIGYIEKALKQFRADRARGKLRP
jgi:hypothetical protein